MAGLKESRNCLHFTYCSCRRNSGCGYSCNHSNTSGCDRSWYRLGRLKLGTGLGGFIWKCHMCCISCLRQASYLYANQTSRLPPCILGSQTSNRMFLQGGRCRHSSTVLVPLLSSILVLQLRTIELRGDRRHVLFLPHKLVEGMPRRARVTREGLLIGVWCIWNLLLHYCLFLFLLL